VTQKRLAAAKMIVTDGDGLERGGMATLAWPWVAGPWIRIIANSANGMTSQARRTV